MSSLVKLGDACMINPRLPKDTDESQLVSFIPMASVLETGEIVNQETRVLSETKKGFTYFERNDILLAKITPCFENGKAAHTNDLATEIGYGSTEFHVLRPLKGVADGKYIFYIVWNDIFRFHGQHSMKGAAGQKRVSADFLKQFKIPLPPLTEQQKIAAILDAADALRQKDQQLIDHYTILSQSLFLEMFGDPVTNPMGWETISLESLGKITSGSTPSRKNAENYEGVIPWVKTTEVNGSLIKETSEHISEEAMKTTSCRLNPSGSLVIAMYGQGKTRGQVGMLEIEAATNQACAVIPPSDAMNYGYLFVLLKLLYEDLRQLGRGGNQPNLNCGLIKAYKVISPSLERQNQFAQRIQAIEQQKQQAQTALEKSNELFNSLLQRAFKGELKRA